MRYLISSIISLLLLGCSSTTPPRSEYRLHLQPQYTSSKQLPQGCSNESLRVLFAHGPSSVMSLKMHYTQNESSEYSYSESLWSDSIVRMVSYEYIDMLAQSGLFESVTSSKSRSKSSYVLEIRINDFMQHFDESMKHSFANIDLTLTLIDAKSNEVLKQKPFIVRKEIEELNAKGGVQGLNLALQDIMKSSRTWFFDEVCK